MREAIVVLPPHCCCEDDVQRRNFAPPVNFKALLPPFAALIDHIVDYVDKGLIQQAVTAG